MMRVRVCSRSVSGQYQRHICSIFDVSLENDDSWLMLVNVFMDVIGSLGLMCT